MSKVLPTKSLFDPNKAQQHQYVPSNSTDVAATWARFRAEQSKAKPDPKQIRRVR